MNPVQASRLRLVERPELSPDFTERESQRVLAEAARAVSSWVGKPLVNTLPS
jgi:hypothetical protein